MKPAEWRKLSPERKKAVALALFKSPRGKYVISQALATSIDDLKKVKTIHREVSNIEDMEMLREELFPMFEPQITQKQRQSWIQRLMKLKQKRVKEVI